MLVETSRLHLVKPGLLIWSDYLLKAGCQITNKLHGFWYYYYYIFFLLLLLLLLLLL